MSYIVTETIFPEVLILTPEIFGDERGFFMESFNKRKFEIATGLKVDFVQDNHSRSAKNVLRGMHYQVKNPQGKLVRVTDGEVYDVVIDMRISSNNFGRWFGLHLSSENNKQLWVPPGFAHGFLVLSETADFQYKTTNYWDPELERSLLWNDKLINIQWPLDSLPIVTEKDKNGSTFEKADKYK